MIKVINRLWAVVAVASAVCISPCAAGAKSPPKIDLAARVAFKSFGDCVVRAQPNEAREIVSSYPIPDTARKLITDSTISGCANQVNGSYILPPEFFDFSRDNPLFAIAESVVQQDFQSDQYFDFSAVPRLTIKEPVPSDFDVMNSDRKISKAAWTAFSAAVWRASFSRYGECVSRQNPSLTHQLILSDPGSAVETRAITLLQPAFQACAQGRELEIGISTMRGLLAIGFYRLSGRPAMAFIHNSKGSSNA